MPSLSRIEFLVEEPSAEAALHELVPKILGLEIAFSIYPHQGKRDLLKKLPSRLRAYRRWLPADWGIAVLIDADRKDCREQKVVLEELALREGFLTRTAAGEQRFQVLNRLAVEELEAWFFGDAEALCAAYPGIPPTLGERARYRNPDEIPHTWEALERELQRAGHHRAGLGKIKAAREISERMEPVRNRSRSFQAFRDGLIDLAGL